MRLSRNWRVSKFRDKRKIVSVMRSRKAFFRDVFRRRRTLGNLNVLSVVMCCCGDTPMMFAIWRSEKFCFRNRIIALTMPGRHCQSWLWASGFFYPVSLTTRGPDRLYRLLTFLERSRAGPIASARALGITRVSGILTLSSHLYPAP